MSVPIEGIDRSVERGVERCGAGSGHHCLGWTSVNGVTWSMALEVDCETSAIEVIDEDGREMIRLFAGGERHLYRFDGQTWAEVDGPQPEQPITRASFDQHYIAVGTGVHGPDDSPGIWAITP